MTHNRTTGPSPPHPLLPHRKKAPASLTVTQPNRPLSLSPLPPPTRSPRRDADLERTRRAAPGQALRKGGGQDGRLRDGVRAVRRRGGHREDHGVRGGGGGGGGQEGGGRVGGGQVARGVRPRLGGGRGSGDEM